MFYISEVDGEVKVGKLLDREIQDMYVITLVAYDLGTVVSLSSEVRITPPTVMV